MSFPETYPSGTTDFSGILNKVKAAMPDVLMAASVRLEDLVAHHSPDEGSGSQRQNVEQRPIRAASRLYTSSSERMPNTSTAAPSGRRRFRTRETRNSSRLTRRNSTALQPFSPLASYAGCKLFADAIRRTGSLGFRKAPRGAPQHSKRRPSWAISRLTRVGSRLHIRPITI